jgi:rfaE bifunctional protein kinase chain/domain
MSLASADQVIACLPELRGRTVLVVGDVVLDRYIVGRATRLSREAPVPVLVHEESFALPGSAANPALNVQAVGSRAIQAAVIGEDQAGDELTGLLASACVDTSSILHLPDRRTCVKQRILARGSLRFPQQVVRIDWIDDRPLSPGQLEQLAEQVRLRAAEADALLLSDYQGGTTRGPVLEVCLAEQERRGVPVCVDAQGDLWQYRGVHCIKCNRDEAIRATGNDLSEEADYESATRRIMDELGAKLVAITRGAAGLSLRHYQSGYLTLPSINNTEVFDVVGAGDTVIALMALGLVAGWEPTLLATVAQLGAGVVIQRIGNATPSLAELERAACRWLPGGDSGEQA